MPKMSDPETGGSALQRAFSILGAFRRGDRPLSLAELSRRTKLSKSTFLRLATTLEQFGYLVKDGDGNYQIGPTPLRLGALYQANTQPADVVLPILRRLAATTQESASYMVRQGDARVCVYRVDSPQMIRDHLRPGDTIPMTRGAGSRIILAFSEPYEPALRKERENLIATTSGEVTTDVAGVAAPIFDASGHIVGSLTITGPKIRFSKAAVARMADVLLEAAETMTLSLGGDTAAFAERTSRTSKRPALRRPA